MRMVEQAFPRGYPLKGRASEPIEVLLKPILFTVKVHILGMYAKGYYPRKPPSRSANRRRTKVQNGKLVTFTEVRLISNFARRQNYNIHNPSNAACDIQLLSGTQNNDSWYMSVRQRIGQF
jgi:hypothetical protein